LFGGIAGAGASAFYLKQLTGDSGSGVRSAVLRWKPTVSAQRSRTLHPIGKSSLILDGSWLPQLRSVNTTKGDYWWVKLTLAF
jgi:hypothetical protein